MSILLCVYKLFWLKTKLELISAVIFVMLLKKFEKYHKGVLISNCSKGLNITVFFLKKNINFYVKNENWLLS